MTFTSTGNSSIFQGGKLKPGIYKIQNLHNSAYLDIYEQSAREMHLRPAQDLGEGRGLVCRGSSPATCVLRLTVRSGKSDLSELVIR